VVAYSLDNGQLFFKVLAFKDSYTMWSVKKTYAQFRELDQAIEGKYGMQIKRGVLKKAKIPNKDEFNLSNVQGLE
jgi:hypothetical protein